MILKVPKPLGILFNKLPIELRRTGAYSFYFSEGRLSCLKYKDFDGWYFASGGELYKLARYQLRRLLS